MLKYIFISINGKIMPINPTDIKWIESDRDYIKIMMVDGRKLLKRCTMDLAERKFTQEFFCRVDRSYIINVNYIKEIDKRVIVMEEKTIILHPKYATVFMQRYMPLDTPVAA